MKVIFTKKAEKQVYKLDRSIQNQIKKFILELSKLENPRLKGKALTGSLSGLWRYRVGDYRILCEIQDDKLIIVVVGLGHRRDVYNLIKGLIVQLNF